MVDVAGGFLVGHGRHGVAHADALVEDAEAHALAEGGLSDEEHREWGSAVHPMVREHAERFHLAVVQEVAFIDDEDRGATPLGLFAGEGVGGLGDE